MNQRIYAHTIFCDDIRQEVGNKPSFMGVYTGEMHIPGPAPGALSKLCAVVWVVMPISDPARHVTIIISGAPIGDEPTVMEFEPASMDRKASNSADKSSLVAMAVHEWTPFMVHSSGVIEVKVKIDDMELNAGRLTVVAPLSLESN